jgi:RHS repeat-associated protein
VRSFTHDGAGNVSADSRSGTAYAYRYNNRGRLDELSVAAQVLADYTYDGLERLAIRATQNMTPSGTTHYVYDRAGHLLAEASGTGTTVREYVWLDDLPLAVVADVDTSTPKLWTVHADHLDRPIRMTDDTKAVVWDAVYQPFGAVYSITGTATNNLRFPGQYFLLEAGLHYNWHRHYDPTLGRYLQPDPLGFVDGPSVYAYVRSSPSMRFDLLGLETVVIINNNGIPYIGGHSGVATGINRGSPDSQALYDPAGSYRRAERGTGDALYGSDVDLNDYIDFQRKDGPDVDVYRFDTTPEEEAEIKKRIENAGGRLGGYCAVGVTDVLDGIGPFKDLGTYYRPYALGRRLQTLPRRIQ